MVTHDRVYLSLAVVISCSYHSGSSSINAFRRRSEGLNSADSLTFALSGFEDYGAYWRSNYETIEEDPEFHYTREDLMHDVRSIYKEVDYFIGRMND